MSVKARELLDEYVQGLRAAGSRLGSNGEVHALAAAITSSAAEEAISADELSTAADGNLIEFLQRTQGSDRVDE